MLLLLHSSEFLYLWCSSRLVYNSDVVFYCLDIFLKQKRIILIHFQDCFASELGTVHMIMLHTHIPPPIRRRLQRPTNTAFPLFQNFQRVFLDVGDQIYPLKALE